MMINYIKNSFFFVLCFVNFSVLLYLAGTNRLATNDEACQISAGVSLWNYGDFHTDNHTPPLARMVATLPLLPLKVKAGRPGLDLRPSGGVVEARDHELSRAGDFAHLNPESFNLVLLARMTGFGWWLLGGYIVFRWAIRLHGRAAGYLGMILWSSCPIVMGYEQLATPSLPTSVIYLAATYACRSYVLHPGWDKAAAVGLMLGVAFLADYISLALLVIIPLSAVAGRLGRKDGSPPCLGLRRRALHTAFAIGLVAWVVNLGYGFDRSGLPLGAFNFSGYAPRENRRPEHEALPRIPDGDGNRLKQSWLGRIIAPVPFEYLNGLARRWHEWEASSSTDDESKWPVEVGGRNPSRVGGDMPFGFAAAIFGFFILAAKRLWSGHALDEEAFLWVPILAFTVMSTHAVRIISPAFGSLLTAPFAIIIASKMATYWSLDGRSIRLLTIGLIILCVGDCIIVDYGRFFASNRMTRLRQDLIRQGRKLGLNVSEPKFSVGSGPDERGLIYRTFVDSKGEMVNYALFVPSSYRGDRPFPLILFLHGWGDRKKSATDRMYAEVGLPFTLKYRSIDFIVLIPQGLSGRWEADGDDARRALELLEAVQGQYRVDPKRISLTGLSSGGSGTWALAARDPSRWAAIVPVAGSCDPRQAPLLGRIRCWCFHNRYDGGTPVQATKDMIRALKAQGGEPLYTEYLDTNHNAGERAYVLPELFEWLSGQKSQ